LYKHFLNLINENVKIPMMILMKTVLTVGKFVSFDAEIALVYEFIFSIIRFTHARAKKKNKTNFRTVRRGYINKFKMTISCFE